MSMEVVEHARDMTRVHVKYGDIIISLARESTQGGGPINRFLQVVFTVHSSEAVLRQIRISGEV